MGVIDSLRPRMGSGVRPDRLYIYTCDTKIREIKKGSEIEQVFMQRIFNCEISFFSHHVFVVARVDLTRALEEGHGLGVEHEVLLVFCRRNITNGGEGGVLQTVR